MQSRGIFKKCETESGLRSQFASIVQSFINGVTAINQKEPEGTQAYSYRQKYPYMYTCTYLR